MNRNIENIKRDLENKNNNDIIWKKNELKKIFESDPDLKEVLGYKEPKPYTKNMTEEQKKEIDEYNKNIKHEQIVPWLKLNGIQEEVLNFIMYELIDVDVSYKNNIIKQQQLVIMCLVHEDDMMTEYDITRTDLLGYIVCELLNWSNCLGSQLKKINDRTDIIDNKYYVRTLKFRIDTINSVNSGAINKYDKF